MEKLIEKLKINDIDTDIRLYVLKPILIPSDNTSQ